MKEPRKTLWQEPLLGALAFIPVFTFAMLISVSVLVGAFEFDPRNAALLALPPTVILAFAAAAYGPTRRFLSRAMFLSGGG